MIFCLTDTEPEAQRSKEFAKITFNKYLNQDLNLALSDANVGLSDEQTGSKLGKEYVKAVYCHPAYLTYMQSTSYSADIWNHQAGIKTAGRNISNLRYADDTTLMAESEEELKSFLMKVKEESEKLT